MKRSGLLRRETRIRPANRVRRARRRREAFGDRGDAVRAMPCVALEAVPFERLCGQDDDCPRVRVFASPMTPCGGAIQAAHVRSRGAGGTRRDLLPLCAHHHALQHQHGWPDFARVYGLDPRAIADRIAAQLDQRGIA